MFVESVIAEAEAKYIQFSSEEGEGSLLFFDYIPEIRPDQPFELLTRDPKIKDLHFFRVGKQLHLHFTMGEVSHYIVLDHSQFQLWGQPRYEPTVYHTAKGETRRYWPKFDNLGPKPRVERKAANYGFM